MAHVDTQDLIRRVHEPAIWYRKAAIQLPSDHQEENLHLHLGRMKPIMGPLLKSATESRPPRGHTVGGQGASNTSPPWLRSPGEDMHQKEHPGAGGAPGQP